MSDPDVAPDVREAVVTRWLQLLGLKHNRRSANLRMASQKPQFSCFFLPCDASSLLEAFEKVRLDTTKEIFLSQKWDWGSHSSRFGTQWSETTGKRISICKKPVSFRLEGIFFIVLL